ncbi:MAG: GNAT family N-acetyltransferase, partial [Methanobacteriota archaeon]
TMKQLGTPPYPKSFYENIYRFMVKDGRASILLAKKGGFVLGGAIFLRFGQTMHYLAGVTPHRNLTFSPNTLLVYTGLKIAQKSGCKVFDFGRTQREGVYNFKKSWGGTEKDLPYYFKALNPDKRVSSSKITSLAPLWRKLIPLSASKILGPPIRRHFGF